MNECIRAYIIYTILHRYKRRQEFVTILKNQSSL